MNLKKFEINMYKINSRLDTKIDFNIFHIKVTTAYSNVKIDIDF